MLIIIIIIITALVQRHKVRRYRGAGGVRLRQSEKMCLEVSFEGVHSTAGSNIGWTAFVEVSEFLVLRRLETP